MKKYLCFFLALIMCLSLCACGNTKAIQNALSGGTWAVSWYHGDNLVYRTITFEENTYTTGGIVAGGIPQNDTGTYTIDGSTIKCTSDTNGGEFTLEFSYTSRSKMAETIRLFWVTGAEMHRD